MAVGGECYLIKNRIEGFSRAVALAMKTDKVGSSSNSNSSPESVSVAPASPLEDLPGCVGIICPLGLEQEEVR